MGTEYQIFLDGLRMPVTPEKITRKIKNQNETINLTNGEMFNVVKPAGLTEYEFTLLIPHTAYPFARYDDYNSIRTIPEFLEVFQRLKNLNTWTSKQNRKYFEFSGIRTLPGGTVYTFCQNVTLEEYKIVEDAGNGDDVNVEIKLKEYNDIQTLKYNIDSSGALTLQK